MIITESFFKKVYNLSHLSEMTERRFLKDCKELSDENGFKRIDGYISEKEQSAKLNYVGSKIDILAQQQSYYNANNQ